MSKNFRYSGDHDHQEYYHETNKKCTDALLASLIEHHGEPSEVNAEPVDLVPAVVEAPKKTGTPMQRWLDQYEPLPKGNYPSIADIKRRVAEHFGISVLDINSERRLAKVAYPRQIGYYLAKKLTPRSMPDIGKKFNRDHTSVLSGIRKIEYLRRTDPQLEAALHAIAALLGGSLA